MAINVMQIGSFAQVEIDISIRSMHCTCTYNESTPVVKLYIKVK
jgi:hypothetical protein